MRKLFFVFFSFLIILLASFAILFGLMNTPFATPVASWLLSQWSTNKIEFTHVEYDFPYHIKLQQPKWQSNSDTFAFHQVDIWLNSEIYQNGQWLIDSILFDGGEINQLPALEKFASNVKLHQLALHNITINQDEHHITGLSLQIKNPSWRQVGQQLPYGEIQFAAKSWQWQGEKATNLLIDANYQPQDSTIYGMTFHWRDGQISGQAEQYAQGWSLVNVTVNHLTLPKGLTQQLDYKWHSLPFVINHINSLDLLNCNIAWQDLELTNADLSLEDTNLDGLVPSQGSLSLHADTANWQGLKWVDPNITLAFSNHSLIIQDFTSGFLQGNIQLAGQWSPEGVHLTSLTAQGLKWFGENISDLQQMPSLPKWENLQIDSLSLDNIQLIQTAQKPFWQLSGLNIEGENTQLLKSGQLGLWNGSLRLSANSASLGRTITSQSLIEMHSDAGIWQLSRAFLPFKQGYLDATAKWDFGQNSGPWQFKAHGDGVPIELLNQYLTLPLHVSALAEVDTDLSGLGNHPLVIMHTLTGKASVSMRQGIATLQYDNTTVVQPFELDGAQLLADRGRLTIPKVNLIGAGLQASLSGELDLVDLENGQLLLKTQQDCKKVDFDLLRNKTLVTECSISK